MEIEHDVKLTSAEIASLWGQYMADTMLLCVNRYMLNIVENRDIKSVIEYSIQLGEQHVNNIETVFSKENFPIPNGFTEQDVNLDAPRLFSDEFYLYYLHEMAIHGLSGYGVSLPVSTRKDIRNYFTQCNVETMEVYNRTIDILLEKGLFERPPNISTPDSVDYIKDKSFKNGWIGERRPLTIIEISDIYFNLKKTILAKTLLIAFSQVTEIKEIRKNFTETIGLANKHIEEFNALLQENNLPVPSSYEDQVTKSTTSPFSDRLIMFHVGFLFQAAQGYYGVGMSVSMRPDIISQYEKIIIEVLKGASKHGDLMIKNGWLEQPPLSDDRKALARSK